MHSCSIQTVEPLQHPAQDANIPDFAKPTAATVVRQLLHDPVMQTTTDLSAAAHMVFHLFNWSELIVWIPILNLNECTDDNT